MNAVEIEEAVSKLAESPFDAATFPYEFLQAFGNNDAAIRKLKSGDTNKSDLPGGVLQRNKNNIHLLACPPGQVGAAIDALKNSPATAKHKARFILATDGQTLQAQRFDDDDLLDCPFKEVPDRFAYFLSLAGISTVKRIDENAFDIRATGRLNKLYVELLRINPDWDTDARRQDLNHFFARLIFCFFAEDTHVFREEQLFTRTVEQMTERDGSNTHEVLAKLFEAMNTKLEARAEAHHLPASALKFPYVNGNLFGPVRNADVPVGPSSGDKANHRADGDVGVPRFSQAARNYLLFVGKLDWKKINPDIFGSMIQAVADDEERGALGMHYTSVPNILKVLNPLFLDDLRSKLADAGDSPLKLLNLRKRLSRIRVFDPACGSGNFLVIAYKEMRLIEAEINQRRGEAGRKSDIPISNFRGIELRSFPAEIARLALIIAEFQCDVLYRGELFACQEFLPLKKENWIVCANALRLDWVTVCPPTGTGVRIESDGLFHEKLDQVEIDFENAGGETYVCGNPPYLGSRNQTKGQKEELRDILQSDIHRWKVLDYVSGWIIKGSKYLISTSAKCAFVTTNSICQGQQAPTLWPTIFEHNQQIQFGHSSFKWANNASKNAGVTCIIIGFSRNNSGPRYIFEDGVRREVANINRYLVAAADVAVASRSKPISEQLPAMEYGNKPADNGHLILGHEDAQRLLAIGKIGSKIVRPLLGSRELFSGVDRHCLWICDSDRDGAERIEFVRERISSVKRSRLASRDPGLNAMANRPHQFREMKCADKHTIVIPGLSSERRQYVPATTRPARVILSLTAFAIYDGPTWALSLIVSKLHYAWNFVLAGKFKTDVRYSNTLGWNTFPVPTLTDQNKADLTRCAEDILLAREAHFPATIAEMYDPEAMDAKYPDLRAAHDRNDETLERIYIGRRFRNDTERLEKLFEMYTAMTAGRPVALASPRKRKAKEA